jgi:hypothetical protein
MKWPVGSATPTMVTVWPFTVLVAWMNTLVPRIAPWVIGPPPADARQLSVLPSFPNETLPVSVGKLFELRVSTRFASTEVWTPLFVGPSAVNVPVHWPVTLAMFVAVNEIVLTPQVMVPERVWGAPKETVALIVIPLPDNVTLSSVTLPCRVMGLMIPLHGEPFNRTVREEPFWNISKVIEAGEIIAQLPSTEFFGEGLVCKPCVVPDTDTLPLQPAATTTKQSEINSNGRERWVIFDLHSGVFAEEEGLGESYHTVW